MNKAILIIGPRGSGKTTLVKELVHDKKHLIVTEKQVMEPFGFSEMTPEDEYLCIAEVSELSTILSFMHYELISVQRSGFLPAQFKTPKLIFTAQSEALPVVPKIEGLKVIRLSNEPYNS